MQDDLNPNQKAAVTPGNSPLLIITGPGSEKYLQSLKKFADKTYEVSLFYAKIKIFHILGFDE